MNDWKKYTGSDDQIDEMCNAVDGYILRLSDGTMTELSIGGPYRDDATDTYRGLTITHYLICNPHPRAEMICQQARTGHPVLIKWRWMMEYCEKRKIPPAQTWAWEEAAKAYETEFPQ